MLKPHRLFAALGSALVLSSLLSACVGIPDSGGVRPGNEISGQVELEDFFVFDPRGPIIDSSKENIVRDFVNAATGQSNDYSTARLYLSGGLTSAWKPHEQIYIFNSSPIVTAISDTQVKVNVSSVASVDSSGHFREQLEQVEFLYTLAQNQDAQWRITEGPNAILLSNVFFRQLFTKHQLYFYSANFDALVPDLRWFPARYSRLTHIVSTLLDGPSDFLSGGVLTTAFPEGTELAIDSVVTVDGVAQVDLTAQVLGASVRQRQLMLAQLNASLAGISGVNRAQISVDRTELAIEPIGNNIPSRNPQINSSPLVVSKGVLGYSQQDELIPMIGFTGELLSLDPLSLFYNEFLNRGAIRTADGIWSIRGVDTPKRVFQGKTTLDPLIDLSGDIWWRESGQAGISIFDGSDSRVIAEELTADTRIVHWAMSRDDTRLVVAIQHQGYFELLMFGVLRDAFGKAIGLHEPLQLQNQNGTALDLVWMNELSVVYAWREQGESGRVASLEIGGLRGFLGGPVPDLVSLAAANVVRQVRVLNSSGQLFQFGTNDAWQLEVDDISLLAKLR
ncbi:MAG: LpqB family beta-propeller domain-containing protein [Microbacteriaceae bacterium]